MNIFIQLFICSLHVSDAFYVSPFYSQNVTLLYGDD